MPALAGLALAASGSLPTADGFAPHASIGCAAGLAVVLDGVVALGARLLAPFAGGSPSGVQALAAASPPFPWVCA